MVQIQRRMPSFFGVSVRFKDAILWHGTNTDTNFAQSGACWPPNLWHNQHSRSFSAYIPSLCLIFFFISYKIYWYQKRHTLGHRKCNRVNKSSKSRKEVNDWFGKADNQSNKVLKKNNFRSGMDLSLSSKHVLFLSLQWHHIKQWGTIVHIWPFWWWPNLPCQQARSPNWRCLLVTQPW